MTYSEQSTSEGSVLHSRARLLLLLDGDLLVRGVDLPAGLDAFTGLALSIRFLMQVEGCQDEM